MDTPKDGQRIVFTNPPPGSYCDPGVVYIVSRSKEFFHFTNEATGGRTSDPNWAVKRSTWKAVV